MASAWVQLLSGLLDATRHAADRVLLWIARLADHAIAITNPAQLPGALWFLLTAVAMALVLVAAAASLHAGWVRWRRPHSGAFVSYHHSRENEAAALTLALQRSGTRVSRLPFLDEVEHDRLLDAVQQGIRRCSVFICLPGARPSFVDAEVAMAFGLQKPMLFVVDPSHGIRLPNMAKKGYPIFDAQRLQAQNHTALVAFVRLIAADIGAVLRAYAAAGRHHLRIALLVVASWLLCLVLGSTVISTGDVAQLRQQLSDMPASLWRGDLASGPLLGLLIANTALVALPFLAHAAVGTWIRERARKAVVGQRFSALQLPATLDADLTRADLQAVLLHQNPTAHHEHPVQGVVVRGRTLPISLCSSALSGWMALPISLLVFCFGVGGLFWVGFEFAETTAGWSMALLSLNFLIFLVAGALGIWAAPQRMTAEARTIVLDEQGLHRLELGWIRPARRATTLWKDIDGLEWIVRGKGWVLGWRIGHECIAPIWLNEDYGMDKVDMMALLVEMHARFKAPGAAAN